MAKKKKAASRPPPPPMPRNTVSLSLDDDEMRFVENFLGSQAHLRYWMLCNAGFRVRFGNRLIYTTPLNGTFYYVLRYKRRYIVFVIMARTAWLIGFCSARGFFQVHSKEIKGHYMDSFHTKVLPFNGNHKAISPDGTGSTLIKLHAIRRRFEKLCDYEGQDTFEIASCLGFFVVLLMESKSKEICKRHCSSLRSPTGHNLGNDWVGKVITNWSSISQQGMQFLDQVDYCPHDCGVEVLKQSNQLLDVFYYYHVDAYFAGLFEHDPMEQEPRVLSWDPVDSGDGDGDILVLGEPVPKNNSSSIRCHGPRKRASSDEALSLAERRKKKRRGLSGGGLGGPAAAPQLFREWARSDNNDKKKCDMLVSHLNLMGLAVKQAKRKLGNQKLEPLAKEAKCEEAKEPDVLDSNEKQTHTSNLPEGFIKRPNAAITAAARTEKPVPLIKSSNLSPIKISALEDGKEVHGTSDSVQVKEKPAATPSLLEHLCEKVKDSVTVQSVKRTHTPKLTDILVNWLEIVSAAPASLTKSNKSLLPMEIASLESKQYISDPIINRVLKNLMGYLGYRGIQGVQLVDPAVSFILCQNQVYAANTAQALNLSFSRLVLLPVNDNIDLDRSGGRHWSLLVFDQWTEYGPRLIHYDSYGRFNYEHAQKVAKLIHPYLPSGTTDMVEGKTPQQRNSYDCGVYLMGIASSICEWCEHAGAGAGASGQDADWSHDMLMKVNAESVASLRTWLRSNIARMPSDQPFLE